MGKRGEKTPLLTHACANDSFGFAHRHIPVMVSTKSPFSGLSVNIHAVHFCSDGLNKLSNTSMYRSKPIGPAHEHATQASNLSDHFNVRTNIGNLFCSPPLRISQAVVKSNNIFSMYVGTNIRWKSKKGAVCKTSFLFPDTPPPSPPLLPRLADLVPTAT